MAEQQSYTWDQLQGGGTPAAPPPAPEAPKAPKAADPAASASPATLTWDDLHPKDPAAGLTYDLPSGEKTFKDVKVGGIPIPQSGGVLDFGHRAKEYYQEGEAEATRGKMAMMQPKDPMDWTKGFAEEQLGNLAQITSVPNAAFDTVIGRGVDQLTGGKVPTRTAGTIAGLAAPFGEARVAGGLSEAGKAAAALKSPLKGYQKGFSAASDQAEKLAASLAGGGKSALDKVSEGLKPKVDPAHADRIKTLREYGMTEFMPGQERGGVAAAREAKKESGPLTGDAIKTRRNETLQDYNRATYDWIAKQGGTKMPNGAPKYGQEALTGLRKSLQSRYDVLLREAQVRDTPRFTAELARIRKEGAEGVNKLPPEQEAELERIINDHILHLVQPGGMDGVRFKRVESDLNSYAKKMQQMGGHNGTLGNLVMDLKVALHDAMIDSSPEKVSDGLKANDKAYAMYKRVNRAMQAGAGKGEIFTPADLLNAFRVEDKTMSKRAFAEGQHDLQKITQAAKEVLPSQYRDSGTAGRSMQGIIGPLVGERAGELVGSLIPIPGVGPLIGGLAGGGLGSVLDDLIAEGSNERKLAKLRQYSQKRNEPASVTGARKLDSQAERQKTERAAAVAETTGRMGQNESDDDGR